MAQAEAAQNAADGDLSPPELSDATALEICVMIAGLPRTGKSQVLNNIFGLDLESRLSARAVTKELKISQVNHQTKTMDSPHQYCLKVVDTPGLQDSKVDEAVVLRDMKGFGASNDFILLLTLPVLETSTITVSYSNILKNITSIFGKEIWEKCVCLLTHSDSIRESHFKDDGDEDNYEKYLKEHCEALQDELKKYKVQADVNPFFSYTREVDFKNIILDGIVAVPVGVNAEVPTKHLLPCQRWAHKYNWTDIVFAEMLKVIPEESSWKRSFLIHLRYGKFIASQHKGKTIGLAIAGAAGGAVAGGLTGGFVGTAAGPLGTVAGGAIGGIGGAIGGGAVGAIGIGTTTTGLTLVANMINVKFKKRKLKK